MINTTRQIINGSSLEKGLIPRPAAKNAEAGDLSICLKTGLSWAPTGHNMPHFVRRHSGVGDARNACFLEGFCVSAPRQARNSRGDINESAEILITGAAETRFDGLRKRLPPRFPKKRIDMAKRPARKFLSTSDAIRHYLREHPDARPSEILAALRSQGILVSSALASKIKFPRPSKKQNGGAAKSASRASGKSPAGDKTAAITAAIAEQGQRFRPRDVIAALAADGVDVSLAEVIAVAQSLGLRPRKRS